jgi:hypothetical protein
MSFRITEITLLCRVLFRWPLFRSALLRRVLIPPRLRSWSGATAWDKSATNATLIPARALAAVPVLRQAQYHKAQQERGYNC